MQGILIVAVVMLLFALISINRFNMLRKMADQMFEAFRKPSKDKYDILFRFVEENRDASQLHEQHRELKELEALLRQAREETLAVDQRVELENKIADLENKLLSQQAEKNNLSHRQHESLSDIRDAAKKLDEAKEQYNDVVIHYNNAVFLFPSNVFAMIFGYKPRKTFKSVIE